MTWKTRLVAVSAASLLLLATACAPTAVAAPTPTPERHVGSEMGWADPVTDWDCPDAYPIKGNQSSMIWHGPGGRFYDRTKPEICFRDAEAAEAFGYRASKL